MMKYLQKLGKALMLPVAVLPICGILMGLGYALAPGVMGVPGAAGVIRPSKNACQVIIGTKVQFVYDELKKML